MRKSDAIFKYTFIPIVGTASSRFSKLSQEIIQDHPRWRKRVSKQADVILRNSELNVKYVELPLISPRHHLKSPPIREHTDADTEKKLSTLQTREDFFLVAERLAYSLHGSLESFFLLLSDVTDIFLCESLSRGAIRNNTQAKRLLYVFYDCFSVACESCLWVKAGLLLCAVGVVEGALYLAERLHKDKMVLFHNEGFKKAICRLSSAGHKEFGCKLLKDAVYYSDVA